MTKGQGMNVKKSVIAASVSALLLVGSACGGAPTSSVEPGEGPATMRTVTPTQEDAPTPEEEPAEEGVDLCEGDSLGDVEKAAEGCPGFEDVPPVEEHASFKESVMTPDRVQVEVIKIQHGKLTRADVSGEQKAGLDYVMLTTRVKNGSKKKLEVFTTTTLTYGENGTEAEAGVLANSDPEVMSGVILPGRSKTQKDVFLIPRRYQKDAVLEFGFDMDHEAVVFSGSLN